VRLRAQGRAIHRCNSLQSVVPMSRRITQAFQVLTSEGVQMLRQRVAAGATKAALAREFRISRETLYSYLRT
jgi:DNA-binding phage protein